MDADNRRLSAEEHVREAMHAEMRSYEQQLATAFDQLDAELPKVRAIAGAHLDSRGPLLLRPIRLEYADLGVLLIVAAACGMMIGGAIVTFWWG